jgi:hypothetical protein
MKELEKNELLGIDGGTTRVGDALRWCKRQIDGLSELIEAIF